MVTTASPATLEARIFGSGFATTGEPAQISLSGDHIEVSAQNNALTQPIADLRIREIGEIPEFASTQSCE